LVIDVDQQERKVRLSLRQADILAALASSEELLEQADDVDDVNVGKPKYESFSIIILGDSIVTAILDRIMLLQSSTQSLGASCSRPPQVNHGGLVSRISLTSSRT